MSDNPLIKSWQAGVATFGAWLTLPGSSHAEVIARQGVDYVCIDYQHGLIDHSSAVPLFQAIERGGSVPVARVNWNEPNRIMQVLDAGARGVVVPMVNDAAEAASAARAFRFQPDGDRSYGPVRARDVLGSVDLDVLGDQACIVMIETALAVRNVREIAATPGVHALYIGPSDLSLALGLHPSHMPRDPSFVAAVADIVAAARDNGLAVGIQCADGTVAAKYAADGFDMITIGSDGPLLAAAVTANLAKAKASV